MPKEELSTDVALPAPRRKRQTASEKARALLNESHEPASLGSDPMPAEEVALTKKVLSARVFPEHYEWFQQVPKDWRARHPRKPKLTRDELMCIAITHLRNSEEDLDALIERYRS